MIAGTWSINQCLAPAPVTDGSLMMNSLYCLPGWYLLEESSPTSAGNNEWFIATLLPEARAHIARAIYEGVVFSHRWHFERLRRANGDRLWDCVRLAGYVSARRPGYATAVLGSDVPEKV